MPLLLSVLLFAAAAASPYDLVIRNGHIIDGTGSPWYSADIAISAGKIAAIGNLAGAPAQRTIDAHGMVVAPGFIDMLGQSELIQGKNIAEIAKMRGKDAIDTVFDLLIEDEAFTEVAVSAMSEADVTLALQQPWVSVCNDSQGTAPDGVLGKEHPHPRAYGTFPRILRKYVREEKKLTLEDAIRKFTALPAQRMRFADRGVLKAGMWADMVVFDPGTIHDRATFDNPNQLSEGMRFVLVNGVPVVDEGKPTNALPGRVVSHQNQ